MYLFYLFLFLSWSAAGYAEHKPEPNKIYNESSQLNVQNINKATEVLRNPVKAITEKTEEFLSEESDAPSSPAPLRDPTQMGGNFRQALRSYSPKASGPTTGNNEAIVPTIILTGKIFVPPTLASLSKRHKAERSSVALSIDNNVVHLKEGDASSIIKDGHLFTVIVESITEQAVQIKLQPNNEILILH